MSGVGEGRQVRFKIGVISGAWRCIIGVAAVLEPLIIFLVIHRGHYYWSAAAVSVFCLIVGVIFTVI